MKLKSIVSAFIIVLFFSCKDKQKTDSVVDDAQFSGFVSEYTSGIISTKSPIQVVLTKPQEAWENGAELDSDIIEISPNTNGALKAVDKNTLVFTPQKPLMQDTQYTFSLDLKKIYKDAPDDLDDFAFFVTTIKQEFSISTEPVQSYDNKRQHVLGQLRTADDLSLETAKKLIKATHNGKSIAVAFDEQPAEGTQFNFKIDNIERQDGDPELELVYSGKAFDIDTEGKQTINIPGKSNFSVLNVNVEQSENPVVKINFSDPIKKGQNFKGLVVLSEDTNPRFSVKGNTLNVYPSKDHTGSVLLEVFDGIESADGKKLKKKFTETIAFEELKPMVRVLSNGTILPSSTNLKINFEAVNLSAVDVRVFRIYEDNVLQFLQINSLNGTSSLRRVARPIARKKLELQNNLSVNNGKWKAHSLDLKALITPEQGAIYRVEFSFRPQYSLYTCESTNYSATVENENENFDNEDSENSFWDYSENYYNNDYDWYQRDNPCHTSYYRNKKASTNVLASNLGVTIKKGVKNSYFVAVANILDTKPVNGAKVVFYNYQQQSVGSTTTNSEGIAFFDSKTPAFFAVAENAGQKTYVRLNDGNALSVSKFKVNGVKLQGVVTWFDNFCVLLRGEGRPPQLVYKHAISTIAPGAHVQLFDEDDS